MKADRHLQFFCFDECCLQNLFVQNWDAVIGKACCSRRT